jgi:predicted ribosome quality control (RQC) complex YloA/Tae2 family protein
VFFDSLTLAAILAEIRNEYLGLPLVRAKQIGPQTFRLALQSHNTGCVWLEISADSHLARIHPVCEQKSGNRGGRPFHPEDARLLTALQGLHGAILEEAEQERFDRLGRLQFRLPSDDGRRWTLWCELMGRHANLILTGPEGKVVEALKRIGAPADRVIWPGHPYKLPPAGSRHSILTATEEHISRMCVKFADSPVSEALAQTFFGISDKLLEHWQHHGGLKPNEDAFGQQTTLWQCVGALQRLVTSENYQPHFRPVVDFWPLPYPNAEPCDSIGEAAAAYYAVTTAEAYLESAKKPILQSLGSRAKKLESLRKALQREMAEDEADRSREIGEILLANLHLVPEKAELVQLPDFYASDTKQIEITLLPNLTVQENAEKYFKRAKKAKSRLEHNARRLDEIEGELKRVLSEIEMIRRTDSLEALERHLPPSKQQAAKDAEEKYLQELNRLGIRRTISQDGYVILYGRNAQGNEHLTKAIAKPTDWWFHARAVNGSHVVIQTRNAPEKVPIRTIEEAARIAAQNSEGKHATLLAVDYTLRKYVRKAKGGKLGLVLYEREKTLHVSQDEKK